MNDSLRKAIMKCALGCTATETVEEYGIEDGAMKLVKKKKLKKEIPPDLKAAQMLLGEDTFAEMDDERLEEERKRLLREMKEET